MKIAKVEAIPLSAPADKPFKMAQATFTSFRSTIVRLTTDTGIVGIGECMVRSAANPAKYIVEEMLAPIIIGRDPLDVEAIWIDMQKSERFRGHIGGMFIEALSGVDIALWDIIGKYHNMPVGKLFGGYDRKRVPAYASSIGLDTPEKMAENTLSVLEQGYRAVKIKIGTNHKNDVKIMQTIRSAVGDDVELMADANSRYTSVREALYVGKGLEELDVAWYEEPLLPDNIQGYQQLAQKLNLSICSGESSFTSREFLNLFEKNCIEVAQPDITRCGGLTESRHIAQLATIFNKEYSPHTGFSSSVCVFATLQLAAWAPNFTTYERGLFGNPLQRLTTTSLPPVIDGMIDIPQLPGICCELDNDYVERYRIDK